MNAEFVARVQALADTGDPVTAVNLCRDELAERPDQPEVAALAAQLMVYESQPEAAVDLCHELGTALPEATWPWGIAAEAMIGTLRDRPNDVARAKALREDPGTDVWAAMCVVRDLLRNATWWPQLVRHMTLMTERTWGIRDQIAIHDELVLVLATKMSDPLAAREAREASEEWRDISTIVQTYWTNLEANSADPAAWDRTEVFFRVNELWADLARLLEASVDGSTDDEIVALWTEVVDVHEKMKDPPWEELLSRMSGVRGPTLGIARQRDRVKAHVVKVAAAKAAAGPPATSFTMPIWVVALIAAMIGMVITMVIVVKYL